MKEKKYLILITIFLMIAFTLSGCGNEANRVSYNLSQQADNFNIVRRVTVIDCITGDIMFDMSGKMSIKSDNVDHQLEITVEDDGHYMKHFIGLSDNVTYIVEDLNLGDNEVSKYRYTLNFNPNMWAPPKPSSID